MIATASRLLSVLAILIPGALGFLSGGELWGGDDSTARIIVGEGRVFIPPELPCALQTMKGFDDQIYLLGKCGTVLRWDPFSGEHTDLVVDDQMDGATDIAVAQDRIALLTNNRRSIRVYDAEGNFLAEYQYSGETHLGRIAMTPNGVVASSFFDDHLLFLFGDNHAEPVRLVRNKYYWPDVSPRFASFIDVHSLNGKVVAVDLTDYSIYVVEPEKGLVSKTEKVRHPWWRENSKPTKPRDEENPRYTGERLAMSSAVANDIVYILWVDRSLVRGAAKWGDGYMELAAGGLTTKGWKTVVRLVDHERFGGCGNLTVIGATIFCINPKKGEVHAFQIADD